MDGERKGEDRQKMSMGRRGGKEESRCERIKKERRGERRRNSRGEKSRKKSIETR